MKQDSEHCPHCEEEMTDDANYYYCVSCSKAYRKCEVYSRVAGYLRPVSQWNKGKREEFTKRKTYVI